MTVYLLEYIGSCADCGRGDVVGAFSSIDKLHNEAKRIAKNRGDDVERYGLDMFIKVHELNVDYLCHLQAIQ